MRVLNKIGLRYNKRLMLVALAGFGIGLITMHIGRKTLLENSGLLSEETLYQLKYAAVDTHQFFWYVMQKRVGTVLILAVLSTTWIGMAVAWAGAAWMGITGGMLCMVSLLRYGLKGIFLIGAGVFPQVFIYLPAALLLLQWSYEFCLAIYYPDRCPGNHDTTGKRQLLRQKAVQLLLLTAVVIIGALLESYVNPALVLNLLKIF